MSGVSSSYRTLELKYFSTVLCSIPKYVAKSQACVSVTSLGMCLKKKKVVMPCEFIVKLYVGHVNGFEYHFFLRISVRTNFLPAEPMEFLFCCAARKYDFMLAAMKHVSFCSSQLLNTQMRK